MAKIFIVEDDESLRTLYQKIFTLKGHQVIATATNGAEAVEVYKTLPVRPDVIVMDHRMPIKNGIEATKEILEIDKNSTIIFASADSSVKELALSIGAKRFELKPFKIDDLLRAIECASA
jgi:two-component system chemotaxis response regulator CheY